jgi:hypothetical protein
MFPYAGQERLKNGEALESSGQTFVEEGLLDASSKSCQGLRPLPVSSLEINFQVPDQASTLVSKLATAKPVTVH